MATQALPRRRFLLSKPLSSHGESQQLTDLLVDFVAISRIGTGMNIAGVSGSPSPSVSTAFTSRFLRVLFGFPSFPSKVKRYQDRLLPGLLLLFFGVAGFEMTRRSAQGARLWGFARPAAKEGQTAEWPGEGR